VDWAWRSKNVTYTLPRLPWETEHRRDHGARRCGPTSSRRDMFP